MNENFSVLTIGYDKYSDVWPYFEYFFNENWKNCAVNKIFVANKLKGPESFECIITEDDEAWKRFESGLNKINTKYCLVLLEDYCIVKPIQNDIIYNLIQIMETEHLEFLELTNFITKIKGKRIICKSPIQIREIMKSLNYRVNLQPAIWNVELLKKIISFKPKTLWDFENYIKSGNYINENDIYAGFVKKPIFKFCNLVDKGCITFEALKYIKKNKLQMPKRKTINWKLNFKNKFKRFLINILPNSLIVKYVSRKK